MIPTTGVIFISTGCNFRCGHCSVIDSSYGKYKLEKNLISKYIDDLSKIPSVRVVVFTGGEPTLFMNELLYGIEYAHKKGFITRLVTNGWWARSYELALKYVRIFKSHGLDEINTSYDDLHAKFASIDNIVNLVKASLDEGLRVAIGINSIKGSFYILEKVKEVLSKKLNLSVDTLEKKVFFIEDQPTPVGEATLLYSENKEKFELNSEKLNVGCTNIGRTLALMPNGDVKICCGHPIFQYVDDPNDLYLIGNIMREDLVSMVKKAQSVLFYWWIHFLGPKKILEKGAKESGFTSICHACNVIAKNKEYQNRIYEYIEKHKFEIFINDIILSDNIIRLENVIRSIGLMDKLRKRYNSTSQ